MYPKKLITFYECLWEDLSFWRKLFLNFRFVSSLIYAWSLRRCGEGSSVAIFQSMARLDYERFCSEIQKELGHSSCLISVRKKVGLNSRFLFAIYSSRSFWHLIECQSLFKKVYVYLSIANIVSIERALAGIQPDLVVVHAEMIPVEGYIANHFRSIGVKTATLQHGLYVDYTNSRNINELNYRDVGTDFFLAWGRYSRDLIAKYNSSVNILICGNPLVPLTAPKDQDSSLVGVVFDQELFREYNQVLLDIAYGVASELNMKVLVRAHPSNKVSDYLCPEGVTFGQGVDCAEFVLGHSSTMMVELMGQGVKVFKLESSIPALSFAEDICFSSVQDVLDLIDRYKSHEFIEMSEYYIEFRGERALDEYNKNIGKVCKLD